eukprot:UN30670
MVAFSKFDILGLAMAIEKIEKSLDPEYNGNWLGVSPRGGKFIACIKHNDRRLYLGCFDNAVEAATAWDRRAVYLRGPRTKNVNFPQLIDDKSEEEKIKNKRPPRIIKFRPSEAVETKIRYGTNKEVWINAEITKVNKDQTYDLIVLQPKKHRVNPFAIHVPEKFIQNKTYVKNEPVETRIKNSDKWIPALVT